MGLFDGEWGDPDEFPGGLGSPGTESSDPRRPGGFRELKTLTFDDSDIGALGALETSGMPQYLIDRGLIDPFEFKMPEFTQIGGKERSERYSSLGEPTGLQSMGMRKYMTPSMYQAQFGQGFKDSTSALGDQAGPARPAQEHVKNWIKAMQTERQNQYSDWMSDFGHFLGGAGTRLASRFDTKEAQINRETLLAGSR